MNINKLKSTTQDIKLTINTVTLLSLVGVIITFNDLLASVINPLPVRIALLVFMLQIVSHSKLILDKVHLLTSHMASKPFYFKLFKIIIKIINIICLIVIILYLLLYSFHVGGLNQGKLFSNLKWPIYHENYFASNGATFRYSYIDNYAGIGNVLKLEFNPEGNSNGYGGWVTTLASIKLFQKIRIFQQNSDFSKYKILSFAIRGETGKERYAIKIKDFFGHEPEYIIRDISSDQWKHVEIKLLSAFPRVSWKFIDCVSFSTNTTLSNNDNCIVYIANIRLW